MNEDMQSRSLSLQGRLPTHWEVRLGGLAPAKGRYQGGVAQVAAKDNIEADKLSALLE